MATDRGHRRRATLAMVSAQAGVSTATVSKVLNGRSDVSAATRARVEQALREHHYVPPAGRRPRPPTPAIELVLDGVLSTYSCEVMLGVSDAATQAGLDLVVSQPPTGTPTGTATGTPTGTATGTTAPEDAWAARAARMAEAGRQGVIVVTSELTEAQISGLERAGIPLVVIDPVYLPRADVISVGSTNFTGGLTATEHLLELGHRRIAYAGGPAGASCDQARRHGYLAALSGAGVPVDQRLISHGTFEYRTGQADGLRLLDLPDPPTAVFAGCDQIGFGLVEAARRRGLTVPADLSVVGFDDTFAAEWSSPRLTTVRQPLQEMGGVAVRTLLRLRHGEALDSHHVELATHLVVRGSTAAPAVT